jgi:initiation factor 1A
MPRNHTGGNKSKRGSNKKLGNKKSMIFADDDQTYARVVSKLGSCRFDLEIILDSSRKLGHLKGSMKNRIWINKDDIVLVAQRECNSHNDNVCDIIHKYSADEVHMLNQNDQLKRLGNDNNEKDDEIKFENPDQIIINDDIDLGPGLDDGDLDDFISNI